MKKDSWNVSLFYKFFISYIGIWGHYSQHLYISVLYFFRLLLLRHHIPFMCFGGQLSTPRGRCVYRAVNGDVSTLRGLLQWPEQFPVISVIWTLCLLCQWRLAAVVVLHAFTHTPHGVWRCFIYTLSSQVACMRDGQCFAVYRWCRLAVMPVMWLHYSKARTNLTLLFVL